MVGLKSLFFEFQTFDAAESFTVNYRLTGRNLRDPQTGTLNVRVDFYENKYPID
jgi:hypothetical protein